MRAAHAVAPNLPPPPEERRPVRGIKPLERSKYHRRRLGTPPRRDADCGSQWRFPRFRVDARPRILGGSIYGESTVYELKNFTEMGVFTGRRRPQP